MERPGPSTGERAYGKRLQWGQAEDGCGLRSGRRLRRVDLALPCDQVPAGFEERRGVLGENRERRQGASGDDVIGLGTVGGGPVLGSDRYCAGVSDVRSGGKAVDDLAFAGGRLDQVDLSGGEGDGQDEAREAGSGADVGDLTGSAEGWGFETGEAVGDVAVDGLCGLGDRSRGSGLGGKRGQESLELVDRIVGQPVTDCEGADRFA
jgi:hypothetical protein